MIVTNPPNVNLSQVVVDAGLDLSGGDYDITMKAGRTVDGKDVGDAMLSSIYDPIITYYLLDDFDDNLINGRNNIISFKHLLKGNLTVTNFRPEWEQVSGTTIPLNNAVVFDEAGEHIKTPSTFAVGTWEITMNLSVLNNNDGLKFSFMYIDADHYYILYIAKGSTGTAQYYLKEKHGAGAETNIILGIWSLDLLTHTFKVTRNASGDFEIFEDGVSKGTVTNTDNTTSAEIFFQDVDSGFARIKEVKIY